jgi:D-alanine-D-alanine ligase
MTKLKVAVICGGNSSEREISLKSGQNVFQALNRDLYEPFLVTIDTNLAWKDETRNITLDLYSTTNGVNVAIQDWYDLAFLTVHGTFGEDGQLQALLDIVGLPYTHSGRLASGLAMDKITTSNLLSSYGILTPRTMQFNSSHDLESLAHKLITDFQFPFILKPNSGGSSISTYKVVEELELVQALQSLAKNIPNQMILAQEFISGRELTCPVVGNTNSELKALAVGEIFTGADFFDYNAKYFDATTEEIFPAQIDYEIEKQVKHLATTAHQVLGCDGLTRSDFILTDKDEVYFLETNTNPGMSQASLCPKAAKLEYGSISAFLDQIIDLAKAKFGL